MPITPLLDKIKYPADLRKLPVAQIKDLAAEVREEVIDAVSMTGGHLGAGLGVVELTVAIHYVFNTPDDKLIWDVGHQCYPHKVLTGRRDQMRTIRKGGGYLALRNVAKVSTILLGLLTVQHLYQQVWVSPLQETYPRKMVM